MLAGISGWVAVKGPQKKADRPMASAAGAPADSPSVAGHGADPPVKASGGQGGQNDNSQLVPDLGPVEEVKLSPYERGSLTQAVDVYVADEEKTVKQIQEETFDQTLLATIDWNSNYFKLVLPDPRQPPSHPSTLKLIVYSRRFAKLIEDGRKGLTDEQIRGVTESLHSDLARWRRLRSEGQSIRGSFLLHSVTQRSDELIVPLTIRINATILFAGQFSLRKALPGVIEAVDVLGVDTNWSASAFACDRILTSLNAEDLSPEQREVLAQYRAWRTKEGGKLLDYETLELPSFDSLRRPGDRATSLGAASDVSTGTISILLPPQHAYMSNEDGYFDPTGSTVVLKKVVDFAREYSNGSP